MIQVKHLYKSFGDPPTSVLKDLNFSIESGEFIAITGRSGSGKSTLLYCLSTLDLPTSGSIEIDGKDLTRMDENELHLFRNQRLGFVFQFHYLLPELTAIENVLMPTWKHGTTPAQKNRARDLLVQFGLENRLDRLPKQLSGGEQQRAAIARALIQTPKYILADEPTGNLDSTNGNTVMEIFRSITRDHGTTVIYVTHDRDYASLADRQIRLVDGCLEI